MSDKSTHRKHMYVKAVQHSTSTNTNTGIDSWMYRFCS